MIYSSLYGYKKGNHTFETTAIYIHLQAHPLFGLQQFYPRIFKG